MRVGNAKTTGEQVSDSTWFAQNPDARLRTRPPFPGEFNSRELRPPRPDREPMVLVFSRADGLKRMLAWRISALAIVEAST